MSKRRLCFVLFYYSQFILLTPLSYVRICRPHSQKELRQEPMVSFWSRRGEGRDLEKLFSHLRCVGSRPCEYPKNTSQSRFQEFSKFNTSSRPEKPRCHLLSKFPDAGKATTKMTDIIIHITKSNLFFFAELVSQSSDTRLGVQYGCGAQQEAGVLIVILKART